MGWLGQLWYFWALISILGLAEALFSFRDGARWSRQLLEAKPAVEPSPVLQVELIIPCAGVDPGLAENLAAFFRLAYPNFRLLLVTSHAGDPAVSVIRSVLKEHPLADARLLFAGRPSNRGQKVHNLLRALDEVQDEQSILVFGDSDIRPEADWLSSLVAGLAVDGVGASTGFRWYLAPQLTWASRLRSAWNSGIAGLLRLEDSPFAWGGAMAIKFETFEACRIRDYWQNSLSDDLSLTRAVKDRALKIRFCPRALSFSYEGCSLTEFWNWSFRQLAITRVYSPGIWQLAWIAQSINSLTIWGGGCLAIFTFSRAIPAWQGGLSVGLAGSVFVLGVLKARQRLLAVAKLFPDQRKRLYRDRWGYLFLGPVSSLFTLAGLIRSAFRREIDWRGIRYRMVSSHQTEVISVQDWTDEP